MAKLLGGTTVYGDLIASGNIYASGALVITTGQTGAFYPKNNPNSYIAGDGNILRMVALGQAAYTGLTPSGGVLYVITGA